MSSIEVKNISKNFGSVAALKNVSITFAENHIYGLLGRNGAGKSTLLNLMTNKIFPTEGEILVDGEPVMENDRALGKMYCMTEQNLYPEKMKMKDVFKWSKEFYPDFDMDYAHTLCSKFELSLNAKTNTLSTGYNSIFKIIIALASNAPIILLDEPVLGLDANHRELFYKELIENYSDHPRTVIISTHLIEEVADIIERVVIIKKGEVLLDDEVEKVVSQGYTVSGAAGAVDAYIVGKNVLGCDTLGGLKSAYLMGSYNKTDIPNGLEVSALDLQKLFIQLTNA